MPIELQNMCCHALSTSVSLPIPSVHVASAAPAARMTEAIVGEMGGAFASKPATAVLTGLRSFMCIAAFPFTMMHVVAATLSRCHAAFLLDCALHVCVCVCVCWLVLFEQNCGCADNEKLR